MIRMMECDPLNVESIREALTGFRSRCRGSFEWDAYPLVDPDNPGVEEPLSEGIGIVVRGGMVERSWATPSIAKRTTGYVSIGSPRWGISGKHEEGLSCDRDAPGRQDVFPLSSAP